MSSKKVKVGVFGAKRGQSMIDIMSKHPDAELVAICDKYTPILEPCKALTASSGKSIECYDDFDRFLEHDMDAVILANYATEHAPYAVRLLDSGRHICSENVACQTMAEAVSLVEAVEKSGKIYTYAENCCYFASVFEMQRLYKNGDIGEFLHGEGEYIHDCESIWEHLTYGQRNHWRNWTPATFYCTHSFGPLMTITDTRPVRVTGYETPNIIKRRTGGRSADGSIIICQMSNGATVKIMPWSTFKKEPGGQWFSIYGTRGTMETDRWDDTSKRLNVYIEGNDGVRSYTPGMPDQLDTYGISSAHDGADFFTMHFFLASILDRPEKEYAIDVYQGLDMTLPGLLGYRSIWEGNIPVEIPDLHDPKERDRYRFDNWTADPAKAGPGQPESCSSGHVEVPDEVYETLQEKYLNAQ